MHTPEETLMNALHHYYVHQSLPQYTQESKHASMHASKHTTKPALIHIKHQSRSNKIILIYKYHISNQT